MDIACVELMGGWVKRHKQHTAMQRPKNARDFFIAPTRSLDFAARVHLLTHHRKKSSVIAIAHLLLYRKSLS